MMRRVLGSAVLALLLVLTVQPAAEAAPAKQLKLVSFTVTISPGDSETPNCDPTQAGHCGYLTTQAVFKGLGKYPRSAETVYSAGNLNGSIEVTRTYGCRDANGKRLHRYDQKVFTTEGLTNYRGGGFNIPATGDTLTSINYVFLQDRLPADCPAGTTPALYKITTGKAQLTLEFRVPGFTNGAYRTSTHAKWTAGQ